MTMKRIIQTTIGSEKAVEGHETNTPILEVKEERDEPPYHWIVITGVVVI